MRLVGGGAEVDTPTRKDRTSALDMSAAEFKELGHRLIEEIGDFYASLPTRDVTAAVDRTKVHELLGTGRLPDSGEDAGTLMSEIVPLLFDHSLHNGHPKFLAYISSSATPFGALADLLAAAINQNMAKWEIAPVATEIETQTVSWLADLIGFPVDCGGIMVNGGNSANIHAFLAARRAKANWDIRREGMGNGRRRLVAYVSRDTHTWVEKAADIGGLGADSIRWIDCDDQGRIIPDALRAAIEADRDNWRIPFLVVGTAGTVGTGAIDPLPELARICEEYGAWFHVDGAYGAPAACLPEAPEDLKALSLADSVALDPHKWLYSPIEAACVLTRDPNALRDTFDFRPSYYRYDESDETGVDYYQHGMQNTRGFRALKVWLSLRRAGRNGYRESIRQDIALASHHYDRVDAHPEFEARNRHLSVTTFRFRPEDITGHSKNDSEYLNALNEAIVAAVQRCGDAFISNAVVGDDYLLRTCVVNFRTTEADVDSVVETIAAVGRSLDSEMRPIHFSSGAFPAPAQPVSTRTMRKVS